MSELQDLKDKIQLLEAQEIFLADSLRLQNAIMITLMEIINETNIGTSVEMTEERINSAAKNYNLKSHFNEKEKILKITLLERSDEEK